MKSVFALVVFFLFAPPLKAEDSFRVLVFSKTLMYRHDSITNGVAMFHSLGEKHGFVVDSTEDSSVFTPNNLARYKIIVFLSTSGDILNADQQTAFKYYMESGGALVGIHAAVAGAVATEGDWPWYSALLCAEFDNHKAIERASVIIEDKSHVSVAHLSTTWSRIDEWYNFKSSPRSSAHVIASLDEKSFHGGTMGNDHPVVWTRPIGKGRLWYTALGHTKESYSEPEFVQHILGGIQFAAGLK
jgi:type 1 glutamine amidotransferase